MCDSGFFPPHRRIWATDYFLNSRLKLHKNGSNIWQSGLIILNSCSNFSKLWNYFKKSSKFNFIKSRLFEGSTLSTIFFGGLSQFPGNRFHYERMLKFNFIFLIQDSSKDKWFSWDLSIVSHSNSSENSIISFSNIKLIVISQIKQLSSKIITNPFC
jgi:hypothetical protein